MFVLIVSTPGAIRDSLHTVLPALIAEVDLANAVNSTQACSLARENRPDLVIINTEIGYLESKRTHDLLLSQYEYLNIIILSDALQWREWKTIEPSCKVLLKGFSTQQFKTIIRTMILNSIG